MSSFKSNLEKDPPPSRQKEGGANGYIIALIGGIFALAAAFVGGAFKGQSVGLGPSPTVTVTKTILTTPGQTSSAQPGGGSSTFAAQAGYISRWQESITIGVNGVVFQQTGPVSAGGSNADLEYFGGPGNGWDGNGNDTFSVWLSSGIPSPKDCVSKSSGYSAMGTVAKQGDRYCFINNQSPNGPIVVSLDVSRVQNGNVTLDAWAWAPQS